MAYKVLLADDSVPAQNMGKKILIEAGYDVMTVSNGLEALRKIADVMPDIAILDIFMPGYTGLEICERLRAKPATAELPVILTVGKLEPYRPEDGEHVGSNAVIVKPFAAAELTAAVRSLIGVRRAEVVFSAENPPPANVADPVEADLAASDEKPLSERLAEMPVEGTDEPLFASAPTATVAESLHAEEPGPESLVFNPDAGRTPFSASAVEAPPAELEAPAGSRPSAVTEFHLELEAPARDLAEPFPAGEIVQSCPSSRRRLRHSLRRTPSKTMPPRWHRCRIPSQPPSPPRQPLPKSPRNTWERQSLERLWMLRCHPWSRTHPCARSRFLNRWRKRGTRLLTPMEWRQR